MTATKIVKSDSINSYHQWDTEVLELNTEVYIPQVGIYGTVPVSGEVSVTEETSVIDDAISVGLNGISSYSQALPASSRKASLQMLLPSSPTLYAWLVINTTASLVPAPTTGGFCFAHRGENLVVGLNVSLQYYVHVGLYTSAEVLTNGSTNDRLLIVPWVVV